jgi:hypothetical protein
LRHREKFWISALSLRNKRQRGTENMLLGKQGEKEKKKHYLNENESGLCLFEGFGLHHPGFNSKPGPNAMLKSISRVRFIGQIYVWVEQDRGKLKEPDSFLTRTPSL